MSSSFLEKLAQPRPDPGGGAAAAYGAGLGLALLEKVVRLEANRRHQPEDRRRSWQETLKRLRSISESMARLKDEDVQAYFNLSRARGAASGAELPAALQEAVRCPLKIVKQAQEALALMAWAGENCRKHLVSDLLVGCEFLGAALLGANHIACANLHLVQDPGERQALAGEIFGACQPGRELWQRVKRELAARGPGLDHGG
jgi:formiminotetrahydrofolate cyclodeaminase